MKDRLAQSIFWMVWSRGTIHLLSFLSTIVVARALVPEDYGLMALASAFTSIVTLLSEMGFGAAIVQFHDLNESEINSCFWLTMLTSGIGYGCLYLAAPFIAEWLGSPVLIVVLRILGLSLLLVAVRIVPDALLRKSLALNKIAQAEMWSVIMTLPVVMGLAFSGAGVWALVTGALLTALLQTVVTFMFCWWRPGLQLCVRRLKQILEYSLATLGARICFSLYQQADMVLLGKVTAEATVGFYSMAKDLATMPVNKISVMINQVASPVMAELQDDRDALSNSLLRGIRFVSWVTFPMSVGLILLVEDFVRVVLTDKWLGVIPIMRILSIYAMIRSVDALLPPVLFARYKANFMFTTTLILLAVMPLAFWSGAQLLGAMGVALAWVLVYPLIVARVAREVVYEVGIPWRVFGKQIWPPLLSTAIMALAVSGIRWGVPLFENTSSLFRLISLTLIGALVYVLCLIRFGGSAREEMLEIAGWAFRTSRLAIKA